MQSFGYTSIELLLHAHTHTQTLVKYILCEIRFICDTHFMETKLNKMKAKHPIKTPIERKRERERERKRSLNNLLNAS